ncbi:hypothetical protein NLX67_10955 [Domibacillus sp. A3M-37]|uniref:hypothetical protein n=1 Tax=Domibacillus sp. A3M-37 TaxID=2962037 RepID=UPI0020B79B38|nr:hypothetical protein [Domibacillus sp. A3M-37]MCP3762906.1 hypothetical protein [Domibacillus sp. A3M-37]
MKKNELEQRITEYEMELEQLRGQLAVVAEQEERRKQFLSSKEIIELIRHHTGRELNMSTIKRWADEGYLGEVIDEKQAFPALRTKQGKKRFLYPKKEVYSFLYEKGYLVPAFDVLDQVWLETERAMVMDAALRKGEFHYTIQMETSFKVKKGVKESQLVKGDAGNESEN